MEQIELYHRILKKYFGFDSFRPMQLDVISAIGRGESALCLMPTGGGKSITFQVPAMAKKGLCLVISPLVALMKDQVENLKAKGIKAEMIHSGMSHKEIFDVLENCEYGDFKFLYVSPERLKTELFLNRVTFLKISMIAVDEAHCISQWGYDFRPSYLNIADILDKLPKDLPILALTATATPKVIDDIIKKLKFKNRLIFSTSFERKNLCYVVRHTGTKRDTLLRILKNVKGSSIIYIRSRMETKEISEFLNINHISASYFHAGLKTSEKNIIQDNWKNNKTRVIVATNAFGMGIDKPDVRVVIHFDLPDSLEAYFQEAGRAGRDGKAAYAVLLYNNDDVTQLKKRLSDSFPQKEFIKKVYQCLANYFILAVGTGFRATYSFSLVKFCLSCKLPMRQTHSALKILELSNYIEITEELNNPSILKFICTREALYSVRSQNPELEQLIELILRIHVGIFSNNVHINEDMLADKLKTTRVAVYKNLMILNKMGIVRYVPFKKMPLIIYSQNRVKNSDLVISKYAYDKRKKRYTEQMEAILEYAEDREVCLNRKLLSYFGQKLNRNCGVCSICKEQNAPTLTSQNIQQIETEIVNILNKEGKETKYLVQNLKYKPKDILFVLKRMEDKKVINKEKMYRILVNINSYS